MLGKKTSVEKIISLLHAALNLAFLLLGFLLLLSCLNGRTWLLEITIHFKLQYFAGSLIFALVFAGLRAWRWSAAAALYVIVSGSSLLGWYAKPNGIATVNPGRPLRLLLSNVLYNNDRYQAVLDLVRRENPDLIFFQEFTGAWERQTSELRRAYPFGLIESRNGAGGIAALSRLPLSRAELVAAGNYLSPTLLLEVPVEGQRLTIVTAHPPPPNPRGFTKRNWQLQRLGELLKDLPEPKVLIGDLNATVWSPYLKDFTAQSGLSNARQGFGLVPTWPTIWYLRPLQIAIDHCLVSRGIRVIDLHTGEEIGSDHLPLVVELVIPPAP
jgi:endonuclease/exonuclease/phosphatase (EEP) superfamily protein YafD